MKKKLAENEETGPTFWLLLPTEEMAHIIDRTNGYFELIEKSRFNPNSQWDPEKVSIQEGDVALVVIANTCSSSWVSFYDKHFRNTNVSMISLEHGLPAPDSDTFVAKILALIEQRIK